MKDKLPLAFLTPVLANYWDLGCGSDHPDSDQVIEMSPHPDKAGEFVLEMALITEDQRFIKSKTCHIDARKAETIAHEIDAVKRQSNRILFTKNASPKTAPSPW